MPELESLVEEADEEVRGRKSLEKKKLDVGKREIGKRLVRVKSGNRAQSNFTAPTIQGSHGERCLQQIQNIVDDLKFY